MTTNNMTICPQCKKEVEVLNEDVQFSLDFHMQSHKSLELIAQHVDGDILNTSTDKSNKSIDSSNYKPKCPECNEIVHIFNDDLRLSYQLHAQNHKPHHIQVQPDNQSSTFMGSSEIQSNFASRLKEKSVQLSPIDNIFNSIETELRCHRGFISENELGQASCNVCDVKVHPLSKIPEHLKTKSHEDSTICFLRKKLPSDLLGNMEFISFHGSNLCCNLCRCNIDLCSYNPHETILNIIGHNAGKSHISKRTDDQEMTDDASKILNSISIMNSILNKNKHLIVFEMQPMFSCKLCDKNIAYVKDEPALIQNFVSHLESVGHCKVLNAVTVLNSFLATYQPLNMNHHLVLSEGSILCTSCECHIEACLENLILHTGVGKTTNSFENGTIYISQLYSRLNLDNFEGNIENHPSCSQGLSKNSPAHSMVFSETSSQNSSIRKMGFDSSSISLLQNSALPVVQDSVASQVHTIVDKCLIDNIEKPNTIVNYVPNYYMKNSSEVFCKICNLLVSQSQDEIFMNDDVKNHSFDQEHKRKLSAIQEAVIKDLLATDDVFIANKQYISKQDEQFLCSLCNCTISISIEKSKVQNSFAAHLLGSKHAKNLRKSDAAFSTNLTIKSSNSAPSKQLTNRSNSDPSTNLANESNEKSVFAIQEAVLKDLLDTDTLFIANKQYISIKRERFLCRLCNCTIPIKKSNVQTSFATHLLGKKHVKNLVSSDSATSTVPPNKINSTPSTQPKIESDSGPSKNTANKSSKKGLFAIQEAVFMDLLDTDNVFIANKQYILKQGKQFLCRLCNCTISIPDEPSKIQSNFKSHLLGNQHVENLNKSDSAPSTNPGNKSSSSLSTQPKIESDSDPSKNPANKSNSAPFSYSETKNDSVPTTNPSNKSDSASYRNPSNESASGSVLNHFKLIPKMYQEDIAFIIESKLGLLKCTLCEAVINPKYLTGHLEEEKHLNLMMIHKNSVKKLPSPDTTGTGHSKVLQNMGSLTSLLCNINEKLSWPVKQE